MLPLPIAHGWRGRGPRKKQLAVHEPPRVKGLLLFGSAWLLVALTASGVEVGAGRGEMGEELPFGTLLFPLDQFLKPFLPLGDAFGDLS